MHHEQSSKETAGKQMQELEITRFFNGPRELVWRAWTEPELFKKWWGPKGFTCPVCKLDVRIGGKSISCMRSPEGQDFWSCGTYLEIVPNERLVMTDSFSDEEGNIVPASNYGMAGEWPLEMKITVILENQNGNTKLTLKHSGLQGISQMDLGNMQQGWNESFDKLAQFLVES